MDSPQSPKGMGPSSSQPGFINFSQVPLATPMQLYKSKAHLQKFLKGEPKALGTVQIIIALMNFSLGMVLILTPMDPYMHESFLFHSGYIVWGTAFFIISGSLSIATEKKITNTLIQISLAMNVLSSVVAGLGIIFLSINLIWFDHTYYSCYRNNHNEVCVFGHFLLVGINLILLILTILEFIISLVVSGFGCKTSCCNQSGVTVFMPSPPSVPENPTAEACKGGTVQSPTADPSALPGSHPDNFV
ncbi:membrane-spanning 4-domains subfamily A member 4A-like [Sminthopsis crassicaudata]|uniref:membrane-spanning 4-domains subfamily A member 4A-like n=1 Tax=Sminthopsis crassicaudata TaxID=9301 RepID=UPI003D68C5D5